MASLLGASAARADPALGFRNPASLVVFGSLEAGPARGLGSVGAKQAVLGDLETSGFRLFAKAGLALERASRFRPYGQALKTEGQALFGHEWRIGDSFVALYAGPDYEGERRECGCAVITSSRYGLRLQADLWATPTAATMLQAAAYVSTMDRRVWGRLASGFALPFGGYLGPEIEAYRQVGYRKLRLGLHLSEIRLFGVVWRLSGGWQTATHQPGEAYATLGVYWLR